MGNFNWIYFFALLLLISCNQDSLHLNLFFEKLENEIGSKLVLNNIKTYSHDSLDLMLPIFMGEYKKIEGKTTGGREWKVLIDSSLTSQYWPLEDEILLFAFQRYLNKQKINLDEIQNEVNQKRIRYQIKRDKEEVLHRKELIDIIIANNLKWREGDTLNIILKMDQEDNYNSIYYNSYPASLNYSFADDTLKMKGILLSKFYSEHTKDGPSKLEEPLNLVFKLKILELSHNNVYNFSKKINVKDEFNLDLESYGRLIL